VARALLPLAVVVALAGDAWAFRPTSLVEGGSLNGDRGGERLQNPQSIWFDRYQNLIVVANTEGHRVMVYSPAGHLLLTLGRRGGLDLPYGVTVDRQGTLYVSERESGKIKVLPHFEESLEKGIKSEYRELQLVKGKKELKVKAGRLYAQGDGRLYIIDRRGKRVVVADEAGHVKFTFGRRGFGPGGFVDPAALTIDGSGRIYVTDKGARRVLVFSPKGRFLYRLGRDVRLAEGVDRFDGIALGQRNNLFTVEPIKGQVDAMDLVGNRIFTFPQGSLPGRPLFFPVDLTFDSTGRLYVLERATGLVRTFAVQY